MANFGDDLLQGVRGTRIDGVEGAGMEGRRPLGFMNVGYDRSLSSHGFQETERHQTETARANQDDRLFANELARFFQSAVGGQSGAAIGGCQQRIDTVQRQQVLFVWHEQILRIAAIAKDAQGSRLSTQVLFTSVADPATTATDPGIDEVVLIRRVHAPSDNLVAEG